MAATSMVASNAAPMKSRILRDIKCVKCNKNVRNGILCDYCDLWYHFKCASIEENEIPDENSEWKCPRCTSSNTNMAIASGDAVDYETLMTIINELREDNIHLKTELERIKKNSEVADFELSKYVSNTAEVSSPELNSITKENRRWESVPTFKSCKKSNSQSLDLTNPIPFHQNQFSVLYNLEVESNEDDTNAKTMANISKAKSKCNSYRKRHKQNKIQIYSDSYGRGVSSLLSEKVCAKSFDVEAIVKPSAKIRDVVSTPANDVRLGSADYVVLIAGANDVAHNEAEGAISTLETTLSTLKNTNIIVVNIPHRYDLPEWSCVNREISKTNEIYRNICKGRDNVYLINTENTHRLFHTKHGQHFNGRGKQALADVINKVVLSTCRKHVTVSRSTQPEATTEKSPGLIEEDNATLFLGH